MNAKRVAAAAGVICASQKTKQTAAGIAADLEAACMLQSPESAAELAELRRQLESARVDGQRLARAEQRRAELEAVLRTHRNDDRAEIERLRARVAELEAARTTLAADRDAQIVAWLAKKANEYGTSNRENRAKAEAVGRLADKLSRGAVRPPAPPVSPEDPIAYALTEQAAVRPCGCPSRFGRHAWGCPTLPVEDPHDSPLHHDYALGHDLPEMTP